MQSPSRSNNPHFYGRSISQSMTSLKKYCSSLTQICEGIRVACVITAAGWSSTHEKRPARVQIRDPVIYSVLKNNRELWNF